MKKILLLLAAFLVSFAAVADDQTVTVISDSAAVYARSDSASQLLMRARKGQQFRSDGTQENGFLKLTTHSGRALWISASDVDAKTYSASDDLVAARASGGSGGTSFRRLTFDLGGSSDFSNGASAYEVHLGVNLFLFEWLAWRNAPFYRMQTGSNAEYGLDSSLEGHYALRLIPEVTPSVSLGGGYRILNTGQDAPFAEAGAGIQLGGLNVGASVKQVFNSSTGNGLANETLYSLNFSGGVSF